MKSYKGLNTTDLLNSNFNFSTENLANLTNWWTELESQDPVRLAVELSSALRKVSKTNIQDDKCLHLLRAIRPHFEFVNNAFEHEKVGQVLPIPASAHQVLRRTQRLNLDFAIACQKICIHKLRIGRTAMTATPEADLAFYWCFDAMSRYLYVTLTAYQLPIANFWRTLHKVFIGAQALNLVSLSGGSSKPNRSVGRNILREYKRVILFGLCDPYRLPYGDAKIIFRNLRHWSESVLLTRDADFTDTECKFYIDPTHGYPAIPVLPHTEAKELTKRLLLDTRLLVSMFRRNLQELCIEVLNTDHASLRSEKLAQVEFHKALVVKWGMHPLRTNQRLQRNTRCKVVTGFDAIRKVLIERDYAKTTNFNRRRSPAAADAMGSLFSGNGREILDWQIADTSVHGYRLKAPQDMEKKISVGELIAMFSQDTGNEWVVGLVRWAKTGQPSDDIEVGVYRLGSIAWSAGISRLVGKADITGGNTDDAICIENPESEDRRLSIVTERGFYKPLRRIQLLFSDQEQNISATHLLLSTPFFDWFACGEKNQQSEDSMIATLADVAFTRLEV